MVQTFASLSHNTSNKFWSYYLLWMCFRMRPNLPFSSFDRLLNVQNRLNTNSLTLVIGLKKRSGLCYQNEISWVSLERAFSGAFYFEWIDTYFFPAQFVINNGSKNLYSCTFSITSQRIRSGSWCVLPLRKLMTIYLALLVTKDRWWRSHQLTNWSIWESLSSVSSNK